MRKNSVAPVKKQRGLCYQDDQEVQVIVKLVQAHEDETVGSLHKDGESAVKNVNTQL